MKKPEEKAAELYKNRDNALVFTRGARWMLKEVERYLARLNKAAQVRKTPASAIRVATLLCIVEEIRETLKTKDYVEN